MPAPEAPSRPMADAQAAGDVFLAAFCEGAGMAPGALGGNMTEAFAHELGRTMRIVATELMAMLQDRATAKRFTRGGERTMISTENNNPLKFLPDSTQALEAMFLRPRAGFLKGGDAVSAGLADVRLHQAAVFAAIQPALARLLSDLAPEAIDEGGEGAGLFGGQNKKRLWEVYVERWDAKAAAHENGMLDVFLAHFAESYAAAVDAARRGQGGT
jgi:type VI secretion system FHA domain protein